jgi:hypothetical protein
MRMVEPGLPRSDVLVPLVRPPNQGLGRLSKLILRTVQYGALELACEAYAASVEERTLAAGSLLEGSAQAPHVWSPRKKQSNMSRAPLKSMSRLPKVSQPPLSHRGATPDSNRAGRPPLSQLPARDEELTRGDRVEGLGDFGKPNGEFGTVQRSNEDDAEVKWDDDGCVRVNQPSLRKTGEVDKRPGRLKKAVGKLLQLRPELR